MESTNFNLGQSIEKYSSSIRGMGSLTNSDAEELKMHLHDSVTNLILSGLSEEEAFMIACKRLGTEETIAQEYDKINPVLNTNKIWAYFFIGFNLLYSIPALLSQLTGFFYLSVFTKYGDGNLAIALITGFHLVLIIGMIYLVKGKHRISNFIEIRVRYSPLRIVLLSYIPAVLPFLIYLVFRIPNLSYALNYPIYNFHSSFTEFSYYLTVFTIFASVTSLIFSVANPGQFRLRNLFERPSYIFLLIYGLAIVLLAAFTKTIRVENTVISALIFGAVYFIASFLIAYYNKSNNLKYIFTFFIVGFVLQVSVGIAYDLERGNTYYTAYFASSMLLATLAGKIIGSKAKQEMIFTS